MQLFPTKSEFASSIQNPKGRAPRACTWVNVKGEDIRSFLNNIYPALGQAKLEFLKNHELARGYLLIFYFAFNRSQWWKTNFLLTSDP